jgi:hypothetical protein
MNHDGTPTDAGILELVRDRLNVDVVDVDVDLIETGMVEERFACELPLDDFDIENFRSARRITQYLDASGLLDTRSAS